MASNASAGAYCASAFAPVTALAPLDVALRAAKKCWVVLKTTRLARAPRYGLIRRSILDVRRQVAQLRNHWVNGGAVTYGITNR